MCLNVAILLNVFNLFITVQFMLFRMWTLIWYSSILAILVADIRTGALKSIDIPPQRCYECVNANSTTQCSFQKAPVLCPAQQPLCGTVAVGPSFTSFLKCLPAFKTTCSIKVTTHATLKMSCVCTEQLCNAPFSKNIQNELLHFEKDKLLENSSDLTTTFFKSLKLENVTDLYKTITFNEQKEKNISTNNNSTPPPVLKLTELPLVNFNNSIKVGAPHAEQLKHEATVPPDDDEDESEGSGSYEDSRSQKNPPSAPAAPSSYLPAEENKASLDFINALAVVPLIICIIL
ncbi:unnamed protein product [Parnassius apollo]|uniref:(apollo) hypothetical protein n=1 Tax=Parnassius apollo TaxID=110799 RepID=A0A8S3X0I5_PARAO|nr:unnamed protein product [Parnassius apollo]